MPEALRKAHSRSIEKKVLALVKEKNIRSVFCYVSAKSEVETQSLIEALLQKGVRVAVPLCDVKARTMQAVEIRGMAELEKDAYGILSPQGGNVLPPEEIQLILVPALAFDKEGYRLGYGGGYYDRYLKDYKGLTVGLAFSACVTEALPREAFDVPVWRVICE